MGVMEFFFLVLIVVLAAAGTIWVLNYWAPSHPAIVDKIIWFVAIAIVVVTLIVAFGLLGHDPKIPSLR